MLVAKLIKCFFLYTLYSYGSRFTKELPIPVLVRFAKKTDKTHINRIEDNLTDDFTFFKKKLT